MLQTNQSSMANLIIRMISLLTGTVCSEIKHFSVIRFEDYVWWIKRKTRINHASRCKVFISNRASMHSYRQEQSRQRERHLCSLGALPADIWGGCGVATKATHVLTFNHVLLDWIEQTSAPTLLGHRENYSLKNFLTGLIIQNEEAVWALHNLAPTAGQLQSW